MAASVTTSAPPAAQAAPDQATREHGLQALRLELEHQSDPGLAALLLHEIAGLHEQRDDLASAARDELAATKKSPTFIEPLESLVDISIRGRSKANLTKLLERVKKLARSREQQLRASLSLGFTQLGSDDPVGARESFLEAATQFPDAPETWLAVELVAGLLDDQSLLLKAAEGRANHAKNPEVRGLLFERLARLQMKAGDGDAALATQRHSFQFSPNWRALSNWEALAVAAGDDVDAGRAAAQTALSIQLALGSSALAGDYGIPSEELRTELVVAAHVRAVLYALKSGDLEEARGQCDRLLGDCPKSLIGLAVRYFICREQRDTQGALEAITGLLGAHHWSGAELGQIHCLSALSATHAGQAELAKDFVTQLAQSAPGSRIPIVHGLLDAEARLNPHDYTSALRLWGESDPASKTSADLAQAFVHLANGESATAISLLQLVDASPPHGASPLRQVLAGVLAQPTSPTEVLALRELTLDTDDRRALAWDALRLHLTMGGRPASWASVEPSGTLKQDPWARVIEELLAPPVRAPAAVANLQDGESESGSRDNTRTGETEFRSPNSEQPEGPHLGPSEVLAYCERDTTESALSRALRVLLIARDGDAALLGSLFRQQPEDPLVSGAQLTYLKSTSKLELTRARNEAALASHDSSLRGAWLIEAAGAHLSVGEMKEAEAALRSAASFDQVVSRQIQHWLALAQTQGDPNATLQVMREFGSEDRQLDFAALLLRFAPDEFLEATAGSEDGAVELLRTLHAATKTADELRGALAETNLLSEPERAVLALAAVNGPGSELAFLHSASVWAKVSPSKSATLTAWFAALRAGDQEPWARAIEKLADLTGSTSLLTAVPLGCLPEHERASLIERLKVQQVSSGNPHMPKLAQDDAAAIAWALAEEVEDEVSDAHADALKTLGLALDDGLDDADARAAVLVAGFDYIALGRYDAAAEIFDRLLSVLPGDPTVCQGACLVAKKLGLSSMECTALRELAQHSVDNLRSAELWERAGVLLCDSLNDPEAAEKCFTEALARSPTSRTAFEYAYRFAHGRGDRQLLVDLIDARLQGADSDSLRQELLWEKARFCRMLGRRAIALRTLDELLQLSPRHLAAWALAAELHLVDDRLAPAAEALRNVAKHPDTPLIDKARAGLRACDLFDQLQRPRDAVELLQALEEFGITGTAGLERRARALARSSDWGAAFAAFQELNVEQDSLGSRLESARMMLAIQRDHVRDPEGIKESVRAVLRDAPVDEDAIELVLSQDFSLEERRRLLGPTRLKSRLQLQRVPLSPSEIIRFSEFCDHCGERDLERVALGNLGLLGQLTEAKTARLQELLAQTPTLPSSPWSRGDIESIADPLQLGSAGRYLELLAPYLAEELDPSLDALGVSSLMRTDEFSGSAARSELGTWMAALGHTDFELYVGGAAGDSLRGLHAPVPTIVLGKEVAVPFHSRDRARLAAELFGLHFRTVTFLQHPSDTVEKWVLASELLAGRSPSSDISGEVEEMALRLSRRIPRDVRDELGNLRDELTRSGILVQKAPYAILRGAARFAVTCHGEASILRLLPELLPQDQEMLNLAMADIVRFVLTDTFYSLRKKVGLEGS